MKLGGQLSAVGAQYPLVDVDRTVSKRSARRIHRLDQHGCFQSAASTQFADRIDREALEIMASDRKKRVLHTQLVVLGLATARLVQYRPSTIIAEARGHEDGAFVQHRTSVAMILVDICGPQVRAKKMNQMKRGT